MKKTLLAVAVATMAFTGTASAYGLGTDFVKFGGEVGVESDYLHQGLTRSDEDASVFGRLDAQFYDVHKITWSIGAQSVDFLDADVEYHAAMVFADHLTAGWDYSAGVTYFMYEDSAIVDNYGKLHLGLHGQHVVEGFDVTSEATIEYANDYLGFGKDNVYGNVSALVHVPQVLPNLYVDARAGMAYNEGAPNYEDYRVGLTYMNGGFTVGAAFVDTTVAGDDGKGVADISFSF